MYITQIKLKNFRNYPVLHLEGLKPGILMVYGSNAQGKTNLIEAVHICANGRSFRTATDANTIRVDEERAYLFVEYQKNKRKYTIETLLEKNGKGFKVNGIPVQNIKDMLGQLYVVVFAPEDLRTLRGAPGLRRTFLDGEISKIRPTYVDALRRYNTVISQKNALLRSPASGNVADILAAYNEQLAEHIAVILQNRMAYVDQLRPVVSERHRHIAGVEEEIEMEYRASIAPDDIAKQLEKLLPREIEDMGCNYGPHRDDLVIHLNGKDVRQYASQGQVRTLMLAMKLACLQVLEQNVDERPVLLLDDVFSELDEKRKQNLLNQLEGIQAFITTAQRADAAKIKGGQWPVQLVQVSEGEASLKKL